MGSSYSINGRRLLANPEFRARLMFTLGALLLFRLARFIPMPGIDITGLQQSFRGPLWFAGDHAVRLSIVALAFTPYLSAWPYIELIRGLIGDTRATRYRLYLTTVFAGFQAYGIALALASQRSIVATPGVGFVIGIVATLVASTLLLIWLGDQITRRGLGNGIWLLIAAEFVGEMPGIAIAAAELLRSGAMPSSELALSLLCVVAIVALIILVELARRHIPLERKNRTPEAPASPATLALSLDRVNILPSIFTASIMVFLVYPADYFAGTSPLFTLGSPAFLAVYAPLFILLTFLITALVASPGIEADRLRKARLASPGVPEAELDRHIDDVMTRLTAMTALYLLAIAVLPMLLNRYVAGSLQINGLNLLISVIVALGLFRQCAALSADTKG